MPGFSKRVQDEQQALIDLGFDVGPSGADGKMGADTRAALEHFRMLVNAPATANVHTLVKDYADDARQRSADWTAQLKAGLMGAQQTPVTPAMAFRAIVTNQDNPHIGEGTGAGELSLMTLAALQRDDVNGRYKTDQMFGTDFAQSLQDKLRADQQNLQKIGYDVDASGKMDAKTLAAVRDFMTQQSYDTGLSAHQIIADAAMSGRKIDDDDIATRARAEQAALADMGIKTGPVDGIRGPRTMAAIEQFRHSRDAEAMMAANPGATLHDAILAAGDRAREMRLAQQAPPVAVAQPVAVEQAPAPAAVAMPVAPVTSDVSPDMQADVTLQRNDQPAIKVASTDKTIHAPDRVTAPPIVNVNAGDVSSKPALETPAADEKGLTRQSAPAVAPPIEAHVAKTPDHISAAPKVDVAFAPLPEKTEPSQTVVTAKAEPAKPQEVKEQSSELSDSKFLKHKYLKVKPVAMATPKAHAPAEIIPRKPTAPITVPPIADMEKKKAEQEKKEDSKFIKKAGKKVEEVGKKAEKVGDKIKSSKIGQIIKKVQKGIDL